MHQSMQLWDFPPISEVTGMTLGEELMKITMGITAF